MKKSLIIIAAVLLLLTACNKTEEAQTVERKFDTGQTEAPAAENSAVENTKAEPLKKIEASKPAADVKAEKQMPIPEFRSKITAFEKNSDGTYSITINGKIKINGITLDNGKAIMPYNEYNGKKYYFCWATDTAFLRMVADSLINKKISTGSVAEFTDVDVRVRDSGTLKGYGEVTVNGEFQIKSIPVFIGGRYGDGIGDPAVKKAGEWVPMVEIIDKDLKKVMKEKVLNKYYSLSS